jgi:radical SAM protein with 4Fe4S-binding SPASM domain
MCNIWRKNDAGNELGFEAIDRFFRHARNFSWVGLTGGEPFLRSDITDIADSITGHSKRLAALHFATNGSMTDRAVSAAEHIVSRNNKLKLVFTISIDGPPELHDAIRGMDGLWRRATETFLRLKKIRGVKPQIGYTISNHNLGRFPEAFASLQGVYPALAFDDININVFQKSGFYYENLNMDDLDGPKALAELQTIISMDTGGFSINNFLRRTYLKYYPDFLATKKSPLKCRALSSTFFIDPAGDVYPCAVYKRKLLNIRAIQGDFRDVWTSKAAKMISAECRSNRCPVCWSPCDAFSAISSSLSRSLIRYA